MKKLLCMICVFLFVVTAVAGCKPSDAAPESDPKATEDLTLPPEIQKLYMDICWPYYESPEKLTEAAGSIFEGEVTNISFGVFHLETGKPVTPGVDDLKDGMLFTIYEVKVTHSYKGKNGTTISIRVDGGLEGYREEEQITLLQKAGVSGDYLGIPICDDFGQLTVGDSYLFLTHPWEDYHGVICAQYAYKTDNSDTGYRFTYEQIKGYLLQLPIT